MMAVVQRNRTPVDLLIGQSVTPLPGGGRASHLGPWPFSILQASIYAHFVG